MFKTQKIKSNTLGERLQNAREVKNLSLNHISEQTRIPISYLKCLEGGDYKNLPADVYVGAYLKKYSEILDLDSNDILKQFNSERSINTDLGKHYKKSKIFSGKKPVLIVTPKRATMILMIVGICIVFGYLWHQLSYLIYPPNLEITQPASDITVSSKIIELSGNTDPDVNLTINGKEVYVNQEGEFKSEISLDSGLNILRIKVKDKFGNTNLVVRRIMVTK